MAKIRESGMPPEKLWESFFNPEGALDALGGRYLTGDVVEFGCGYGTFTIASARRSAGLVYALDIDPIMVAATTERATSAGVKNVVAERRDFMADGCGRPGSSVRYAMLFNILHLEEPVSLLQEALRVLQPSGTAGVMHWNRDRRTPRGPPMQIRPSPTECVQWAKAAGFRSSELRDLPGCPWHWGLILLKQA